MIFHPTMNAPPPPFEVLHSILISYLLLLFHETSSSFFSLSFFLCGFFLFFSPPSLTDVRNSSRNIPLQLDSLVISVRFVASRIELRRLNVMSSSSLCFFALLHNFILNTASHTNIYIYENI